MTLHPAETPSLQRSGDGSMLRAGAGRTVGAPQDRASPPGGFVCGCAELTLAPRRNDAKHASEKTLA